MILTILSVDGRSAYLEKTNLMSINWTNSRCLNHVMERIAVDQGDCEIVSPGRAIT